MKFHTILLFDDTCKNAKRYSTVFITIAICIVTKFFARSPTDFGTFMNLCTVKTVSARYSEGPPFRRAGAAIPMGPPFSAISSSDNLRLEIQLGLGSIVWLRQYQELFHATTMNDSFQNGGPFGMADRNRKVGMLELCDYARA